jgi:hypothetical protein
MFRTYACDVTPPAAAAPGQNQQARGWYDRLGGGGRADRGASCGCARPEERGVVWGPFGRGARTSNPLETPRGEADVPSQLPQWYDVPFALFSCTRSASGQLQWLQRGIRYLGTLQIPRGKK